MIISIASGKGGTGKTTVATNLASALGSGVQLIDCDVEEPNAHLFIKPVFESTQTVTIPVPVVEEQRCNLCGKCGDICQFKAILPIGKTVMVFEELCHSCGGCIRVCPQSAITEKDREIGIIQKGRRNGVEFVHGRLRIGEPKSPPLIRAVRTFRNPDCITIIDAPPGTSCPVITSIKHTDVVVLVTEPTPFGLHDLRLTVEAIKYLNIPCGIVVNRSGMGDDRVLHYAQEEHLPVWMQIPFDRRIAEICSKGELLIHVMPEWKDRFLQLYQHISQVFDNGKF